MKSVNHFGLFYMHNTYSTSQSFILFCLFVLNSNQYTITNWEIVRDKLHLLCNLRVYL